MSKFCRLLMAVVLIAVLAGVFGVAAVASPTQVSAAMMTSSNVAIVPSYNFGSAGHLQISGAVDGAPTLSFGAFTFTNLPLASVTLANLQAFDTVVLFQNQTSSLTAQVRADLNAWVDAGGKLIIYDSDSTTSAEYSWLIRPFTTQASPGQTGSMTGTLTIVEENTLSSNNPASPYYINTTETTDGSDAVGDANVFATQDPNWFGDMTATNVINNTGWTHAYAETPSGHGLLIYNGLDTDYMDYYYNYYPSGIDWLAKIWYQELMQPWDPSGLPGTTPVASQLLLSPLSNSLAVGQTQTMTALASDTAGAVLPGIIVTFTVTGVNPTSGSATTDVNGVATWSYAGANEGVDTVVATATINAASVTSNDSHITWTPGMCPPVPEQSTVILLGMGLLTLGGVGMMVVLRQRRTATA